MVDYWHDIPAKNGKGYNAVIEIPAGSSSKFEYDKENQVFKLDRVLYTSTHYPANYGFIPQTYADDNDPLDILVLCRKNVPTGILMAARIVGVFHMVDGGDNDEKILAVSCDDPTYKDIMHIDQLPPHLMQEIQHFFKVYKDLEGKKTEMKKFMGREDAIRIIDESIKKYKKKFKK